MIDGGMREKLSVGTRLVARYKREEHVAEVVAGEDGKKLYRLADGREFKSPSAAASAVMGGQAANGWRFWSQEGEIPSVKTVKPTKVKAVSPAKVQQIRRTRSQKGTPEGQVKWACSSCMSTFLVEGDATPDACPDGHPREVVDDLANVS